MFDPEIFGFSSSALWGFAQALLTPTLGFLFIFVLGLPLGELRVSPGGTSYKQPRWVLPIFAHGSTFALVAIVATNIFLNREQEPELANTVMPELFLTRELQVADTRLTKVSIIVKNYDGLSNFRIFVNGYHVFSSNRDCVAAFQCTDDAAKASADVQDFKKLRVSGGSLYDLARTNDLPYEVVLNHYLGRGKNHIELVSENSGTGGCVLGVEVVAVAESQERRHRIDVSPDPGATPAVAGPLAASELLHSGGEIAAGNTIMPYKTPKLSRGNSVCQRIRVSLELNERHVQSLSSDADFSASLLQLHEAYVCETIGKVIRGCEPRQ